MHYSPQPSDDENLGIIDAPRMRHNVDWIFVPNRTKPYTRTTADVHFVARELTAHLNKAEWMSEAMASALKSLKKEIANTKRARTKVGKLLNELNQETHPDPKKQTELNSKHFELDRHLTYLQSDSIRKPLVVPIHPENWGNPSKPEFIIVADRYLIPHLDKVTDDLDLPVRGNRVEFRTF